MVVSKNNMIDFLSNILYVLGQIVPISFQNSSYPTSYRIRSGIWAFVLIFELLQYCKMQRFCPFNVNACLGSTAPPVRSTPPPPLNSRRRQLTNQTNIAPSSCIDNPMRPMIPVDEYIAQQDWNFDLVIEFIICSFCMSTSIGRTSVPYFASSIVVL